MEENKKEQQLTPLSSFEAYDAMVEFKKTYTVQQIEDVNMFTFATELVAKGIFKDMFSVKMYLLQSLEVDFINGDADIPLKYYTEDEKIEMKETGIGMTASIDKNLDCRNIPNAAIQEE